MVPRSFAIIGLAGLGGNAGSSCDGFGHGRVQWRGHQRHRAPDLLLKREGLLALEIGFNQYRKVSKVLKSNGYRELSTECDYNQNVRCIISTKVNFF